MQTNHRIPCQTEGCGGKIEIRIFVDRPKGILILDGSSDKPDCLATCPRCGGQFRVIQLSSGVGILPAK